MGFLAGENITAGRLNRLQPKTDLAIQSGPLNGPSTNALVPGCTISITTEAPNAEYLVTWHADFDLTSATTGTQLARARVNGAVVTTLADFAGEVSTDRGTTGNQAKGTLPAAGTHTFELVATLGSGASLNSASTISVIVTEVA